MDSTNDLGTLRSPLWTRFLPLRAAPPARKLPLSLTADELRAGAAILGRTVARGVPLARQLAADLRASAERFSDDVVRPWLVGRLMEEVLGAVLTTGACSVLEVGCGEGAVLGYLGERVGLDRLEGVDRDPRAVDAARRRVPGARVQVADARALPFEAGAFDLVLCLGLLEHLERPAEVLAELHRVSARVVLVSVPDEPSARLANLLTGQNVRAWGGKPEHCQHWVRPGFVALLEEYFVVRSLRRSFPWLVALGEKPPHPGK